MKLLKSDLNHVFRHIKPTYTHLSANDQLLPYIVNHPFGVAIPSQETFLGRELDGRTGNVSLLNFEYSILELSVIKIEYN